MVKKGLAEIYHEETKYHETGMAKFQRPLDWGTQPLPHKEYQSERKIDLIPYLPFQNNPFTGEPLVPAKEQGGYPFGIGEISRLLYFTNGVTGILQYPTGQTLTLRAAPTAGGLYPTEIYIAVRGLSGLEDGIYNFEVKDHSLILVWEGNFWEAFSRCCIDHEAIEKSNLLVIMTAIYRRSAWRYQERAYRRILLDTGHIVGNLSVYAPEEGFVAYPIGGFFDTPLNRLLFLDEEEEGVLVVTALPQREKVNPERVRPISAVASKSFPKKEEDPKMLQLQLHRASSIFPEGLENGTATREKGALPILEVIPDLDPLDSKYRFKESFPLPETPIDWGEGIGQTILLRRSTRAYSGQAFLKEELGAILRYAYLPLDARPIPFFDPSLLETYLVVQNVVELSEGAYYYAPRKNELRLLAAGDFREQTWHFCLGQELARDAAVLVIHIAHLKAAVERYGDRAYRYLHLDAGHLGERINLAAIRLGLGVSGIGGFYDDEVNALFGLSLDEIVVYVTTLGRPRSS